jgi:hypothetical protein
MAREALASLVHGIVEELGSIARNTGRFRNSGVNLHAAVHCRTPTNYYFSDAAFCA